MILSLSVGVREISSHGGDAIGLSEIPHTQGGSVGTEIDKGSAPVFLSVPKPFCEVGIAEFLGARMAGCVSQEPDPTYPILFDEA